MCVIAVSPAGCRQPTKKDFQLMWEHNPHGAGVMYPGPGGLVYIHKGFMTFDDFMYFVREARFVSDDPVVYHFRISTQAGTGPEMTHPFPLTADLSKHLQLSQRCEIGIAHNGIIRLTSDPTEKTYSDTSLFIARYLPLFIRSGADLDNPMTLDTIRYLAGSKFAIMRGDGRIYTVGDFYKQPGNFLVSNEFYKPARNFPGWSYDYNLQGRM